MTAAERKLLMKGCSQESQSTWLLMEGCSEKCKARCLLQRREAADERLLTRISVNMAADGRLL